jgi:hypothetical protein
MDDAGVGRASRALRHMDERDARELRARIERVARELEALREVVAPDARGRMTELVVRHLSAALESAQKAADELTVGFGLD